MKNNYKTLLAELRRTLKEKFGTDHLLKPLYASYMQSVHGELERWSETLIEVSENGDREESEDARFYLRLLYEFGLACKYPN